VIFTSESVTEGHPDKLCDQISDTIVDHFLKQDPYARVRAECAVSSAIIFIAARYASDAKVDFSYLARKVIQRVGYDQPDFNSKICSILSAPQELPLNAAHRFDENSLTDEEIDRVAAKNQVTVFGFACDQTPELMPLPIILANRLARRLAEARHQKLLPYLLPDGKTQVGVAYDKDRPVKIHSLAIMASVDPLRHVEPREVEAAVMEHVVAPVFAREPIRPDRKTRVFVNPDGPYQGGPTHHSGLTGRKSAVDTYGEYARHSGDALSGKDPMRVDRVGAYAARYAAKNVVAAGLASQCEVMLSYSIGVTRPVSLVVKTFGSGTLPDERIRDLVEAAFDFRLAAIMKHFRLRYQPSKHPQGYFQRLAAYGHFGRDDMELPWEMADRADELKAG
jgi:S-adenosylmethionine synthetase